MTEMTSKQGDLFLDYLTDLERMKKMEDKDLVAAVAALESKTETKDALEPK